MSFGLVYNNTIAGNGSYLLSSLVRCMRIRTELRTRPLFSTNYEVLFCHCLTAFS